jgi:polyhydroxybutyrate depolymerase
MRRVLLILAASLTMAACSNSTSTDGDATAPTSTVTDTAAPDSTAPDTTATETTPVATEVPPTTVAAPDPSRPYKVFVPTTYTEGTAMPLVVLLHGYGASGDIQEAYFQVEPLAETKGFLYAHLDGTKNVRGDQFWNATDACCGFGTTVDDVAYVTAVIDDISANYDIDPKRIFLMGHSNGGFMSYRMACDKSGRIAAIASLAGATFGDQAKCSPSEPVSVLQVHGTADGTISYTGGTIPVVNGIYPGAEQSADTWGTYNGCTGERTPAGAALDLEPTLADAESQRSAIDGCPSGVAVELITVNGGAHIPGIVFPDGSHHITEQMVDFLLAHPKA